MAASGMLTVIITQADKVIVSRMLSLADVGLYTLASAYGMLPMMLASTISNAVTPRLTRLVASDDDAQVSVLFHKAYQLIALVTVPVIAVLLAFPTVILQLWSGKVLDSSDAGLLVGFLICGNAVQIIGLMPYCLTLGHGDIRSNLYLGLSSAAVLIPLSLLGLSKVGIVGGGIAWLLMNICTVPVYCVYVMLRYRRDDLSRWGMNDVGRPICVALLVVYITQWIPMASKSMYESIMCIVVTWLATSASLLFLVPHAWESARLLWKTKAVPVDQY
jgi:O-antigen/teichoic acid export membrane protein